jgi:hypothetical protein
MGLYLNREMKPPRVQSHVVVQEPTSVGRKDLRANVWRLTQLPKGI